MATDDMALVRDYAANQSEQAFETLVEHYVNLVYSTALRQVRDAHLAEEIAQGVFIILARKAGTLGPNTILPSWLYRTAGFVTADALKTRRRRQQREQEAYMQSKLNEPENTAWRQIAPLLDAAIAGLNENDRHTIVLRFFQNKSLNEIGAALGTSEEAAKKRVNRALDKLQNYFSKRGVNSTAETVAGAISACSVQMAPTALTKSITAVAVAKGATASTSILILTKGALKVMAWTKAKTAIVVGAGLLLATGTGTVLIEKQVKARQFTPAQAPWSDAGAATPKAALQTLAWALTQGKTTRADRLMQWEETNTNYGNPSFEHQIVLQSILAPAVNDIENFKILSITPAGPDEAIVKFKKTFKQGNLMPMTLTARLHRVGSEWHVVGKIQYYPDGGVSTYLPFFVSF